MPSLFHSLGVGSGALYATRQGIDTTAHNIANSHTEGFSRQRVVLAARPPSQVNTHVIGNGVLVGSVVRAHNQFLQQQIHNASANDAGSKAKHEALLNLENVFSPELTSTVSKSMDAFFASVQELASRPEELSIRVSLREQAKNLVSAFRAVDERVQSVRVSHNEQIRSLTKEADDLLSSLAEINMTIKEIELSDSTSANDLRDQRDSFLNRLSEIMNVRYYDDQYGMVVVRGPGDVLLVEGGNHSTIGTDPDPDNRGMYNVKIGDWEGRNPRKITDNILGGKLAGLLQARDEIASELIAENNRMAKSFAEAFNDIHRRGFGVGKYSGQNGVDFFTDVEDEALAGRTIAISDIVMNTTDAIAGASTANAPGDNVIANQLYDLRTHKILGDGQATFNEYYANYVSRLGIETQRAQHISDADGVVLANLNARREAVAGVSLDEEAANMIRWQTAFTAASKVIKTVDEMLETVLSLRR